jgi:hypothetical protein
MMNEFAVFATALERRAMAFGHHTEIVLCNVGVVIANPNR